MSRLTPESKVKLKISALLKKYDVWYFFPMMNGFGTAGVPDIICCPSGIFVGVEAKADKTKKPTKLQVLCGQRIQASGGHWMVVCDDDSLNRLEDLLCVLLKKPKQSP